MLITLLAACTSDPPPATGTPPPIGEPPALIVRFPPSGAIESDEVAVFGTATDPEGGEVTVTVTSPDGTVSTAVTGADGAFRLDGVPLGANFAASLIVRATDSDGHASDPYTIELERGPTLQRPSAVVQLADGALIYADRAGLSHIDPATGARERLTESLALRSATAIEDGILAVMGDDIVEFRPPDWEPVVLTSADATPKAVAVAQDGTLIVSMDRAIGRWDPATGGPIETVWAYNPYRGSPHLVVTGDEVLFKGSSPGNPVYDGLVKLDLITGQTTTIATPFDLVGPVFSDGLHWALDYSGQVFEVDPDTGATTWVATLDGPLLDLGPSDSGVLITARSGDVLRVLADGTASTVSRVTRGSGPAPVTELVHALSAQRLLVYWRTPDSETELGILHTGSGDRQGVRSLPFLATGATVAADRLWMLANTGRIYSLPLTDLAGGSFDTLGAGTSDPSYTELVTDGTTAWSLRHIGYTASPDPVKIELQAGSWEGFFPTSGSFRVHHGLVLDPAGPTRLASVGSHTVYTYDLANGEGRAVGALPYPSNWTLEAAAPGKVLVGDRHGQQDSPTMWVDLTTGVVTPFETTEPRMALGSMLNVGEVIYESDPLRWAVLAIDPLTGQSVVFSR